MLWAENQPFGELDGAKGDTSLSWNSSTYYPNMSTVTGRRQPCGKKGKFRQSLLLFSSFHLTLKTLQEDRELWWPVSVLTARSVISGQRLGRAESPAGGVGRPALSDYAVLQMPNSECAVGLIKCRAGGRLIRMRVLECHVAIFFHHLKICILYWMGSSDLEIFIMSFSCMHKREHISKINRIRYS